MELKEHNEILQITALVLQINALRCDFVLSISLCVQSVVVNVFDCRSRTDQEVTCFEFDECYLPKLRKLRHDLEQIRNEAREQRGECVA